MQDLKSWIIMKEHTFYRILVKKQKISIFLLDIGEETANIYLLMD